MGRLISGKEIAQQIKDELKIQVEDLLSYGTQPRLAVIQVGDNPASTVYVRNKQQACKEIGIESDVYKLKENATQRELLTLLNILNSVGTIDGTLVQLPLPPHIDEKVVIETISPKKDVDGFHPVTVGNMHIGTEGFLPCTPAGVIELLKRSGVEIEGKECVIVGRSNIVGKPLGALLLRENGTVTIAHSKTKNLQEVCKRADILITAIGKPRFITREYVKEGAVVIDVGINRDENNKLCGDVDFLDVVDKVEAITPVPGGVGPMTIAMLMKNCVESAKRRNEYVEARY